MNIRALFFLWLVLASTANGEGSAVDSCEHGRELVKLTAASSQIGLSETEFDQDLSESFWSLDFQGKSVVIPVDEYIGLTFFSPKSSDKFGSILLEGKRFKVTLASASYLNRSGWFNKLKLGVSNTFDRVDCLRDPVHSKDIAFGLILKSMLFAGEPASITELDDSYDGFLFESGSKSRRYKNWHITFATDDGHVFDYSVRHDWTKKSASIGGIFQRSNAENLALEEPPQWLLNLEDVFIHGLSKIQDKVEIDAVKAGFKIKKVPLKAVLLSFGKELRK